MTGSSPGLAASPPKVKPALRGVFHQFGFVASLGGLFFLAIAPSKGWQYAAGLIYGASLCLTLGLSALYHRPNWSEAARERLRRFDHAGIFALIAGTFTPVATRHAHGEWDLWLTVMWSAALAGAVFVFAFTHAHRGLRAAVYVVIGLVAAPVVWNLTALIGPGRVALLAGGAGIYIAGAAVYAKRWPNPRPHVFGYHECFHLMVLAAAAAHYAVVIDLQFN
jgi:hemolysin III